MDIDGLVKGQDYTELKPNYVLFICKKDPFRDEQGTPLGLPSYTFVTGCVEDKRVNFNDKITKVVYNANGEYAAMNLREMDIRREERQAALAEGMQIGLSKGLKQGEHEAKINAAKAMLADGVDINLIVKYTGLSVEKLKTESGKWEAEN